MTVSPILQDILYISGGDYYRGQCRIKYNNMQAFASSFAGDMQQLISRYIEISPCFHKGLIWFYEKETRWLVEVPQSLLEPGKEYKVVASIPDSVISKIKIRLAPEFSSTGIAKLKENTELLTQLLFLKPELSDHDGQIAMNLKERFCSL